MGRHREFDEQDALRAIKDVFWAHGYEGASMALIESATGLRKQSLYRAFGDKRAMYLAALRDYDMQEVAEATRMLRAPGTAAQRIDTLLAAIIEQALATGDRRGCLLCNASVDQAPVDPPTSELVGRMMRRFLGAIEQCLNAHHRPGDAQATPLACAVLAGYFGIRVMIKAGMPRPVLDSARQTLVGHVAATLPR